MKRVLLLVITGITFVISWLMPSSAQAIPAFSRMYGQSCGACHTAIPALNQAGEEFRLSGYTRYEGGAAVQKIPPLKIGRMSIPATVPISIVGTVGFDARNISERDRETIRTLTSNPNSFNLEEIEILAAAPLNEHVSFILDFPMAETEFENRKFTLMGPDVPSLAAVSFNNIFIGDVLNLRLGAYELPVGHSPEHRRLSIAPYEIYQATAQKLLGLEGPAATGIAEEGEQFSLAQPQLLAELYGTAYAERLGVSNLYVRYHIGASNDSNVAADNNGSKSVFGQLAATFFDQTLGFFGIYSPNTLDRTRPDGFPGLRNSVAKFGPHAQLRFFNERLTVRLQHLWARESDPTGVGTPFRYQGGFAELNYILKTRIGDFVPLGRFDYVLANRFDNTAKALDNPLAPSPVVTKPNVFAYTVGVQFLPWENVKISPEFTYREQQEQLSKTVSTAEHDRVHEYIVSLQVKVGF